MKRLILFSMVCLMATATQAQNDSIKNETMPEVVVNADGQIEMADKTVLLPTTLEKKHSHDAQRRRGGDLYQRHGGTSRRRGDATCQEHPQHRVHPHTERQVCG